MNPRETFPLRIVSASRAVVGFPSLLRAIVGDQEAVVTTVGVGATRARSSPVACAEEVQAAATAASGSSHFVMPVVHRGRTEGSARLSLSRRSSDTHA